MRKKNYDTGRRIFFFSISALAILYTGNTLFFKNIMGRGVALMLPDRHKTEESKEMLVLLTQIKNIKQENETLKNFINKNRGESKNIRAGVKFGGGYIFSDSFFIDSGKEKGIKVGDIAVSADNVLIGAISVVGNAWSEVQPFSQIGKKITIKAGLEKTALFEGHGIGMGEISATLPRSANISVGESAWWGENQQYLVGLVDTIENRDSNNMNTLIIKNPYPLKNLTDVVIIPI